MQQKKMNVQIGTDLSGSIAKNLLGASQFYLIFSL